MHQSVYEITYRHTDSRALAKARHHADALVNRIERVLKDRWARDVGATPAPSPAQAQSAPVDETLSPPLVDQPASTVDTPLPAEEQSAPDAEAGALAGDIS